MIRIASGVLHRGLVDLLHAQQRVGFNPGPVSLDFELVLLPERIEECWNSQQIGELLPFTSLLPLPGEFVELAWTLLLHCEIPGECAVRSLLMTFSGKVCISDGLAQKLVREGEEAVPVP